VLVQGSLLPGGCIIARPAMRAPPAETEQKIGGCQGRSQGEGSLLDIRPPLPMLWAAAMDRRAALRRAFVIRISPLIRASDFAVRHCPDPVTALQESPNMSIHFQRHPENPIVVPGKWDWRLAAVFNPAVIYDEGRFYMWERTAGGLRPYYCYFGMLVSDDGVHFEHVSDKPVFTPTMAGSKYGSVQDPRVVRIGDTYYMTYAYRPYAWSCHPTGVGVPEAHETVHPGVVRPAFDPANPGSSNVSGNLPDNMTRSGLAISKDRVNWKHHVWLTPDNIDDRDVILFPEKINGRFALLRRPLQFVGPRYGVDHPSIWITFSEDLENWSEPQLLAKAEYKWEDNRIGGSMPPIRTSRGWLTLYHGVETVDPKIRRVIYRMGAMMLDLKDPTKVIARCKSFVMEPETYYEKFGLYIPYTIFPTAGVVKDGILHVYYGCCDTSIALATIPLEELVEHVMRS
jgi:predicted GH43/DUF377 family glycosyl hydrolase